MKLTRQRKVSLAILAVAGAALAADRFFLDEPVLGPAPATAASTAAPAPQAGAPAAPARVITVADRLEGLRANATASLDAFGAPADWLPEAPAPEAAEVEKVESETPPVLTGVIRLPGAESQAYLNNTRVKVGESVGGWTVEKILGDGPGERPSVIVVSGSRRETVMIATDFSKRGFSGGVRERMPRSQAAAKGE